MNKYQNGVTLEHPDESAMLPCLFAPPEDGLEQDGALAMEAVLLVDQPDAEPMPDFIQDMLEVAGIPRSISAGECLHWFNGCKTSIKYESASVKIDVNAGWFELTINHQSGRLQRLRCTRYGDLVTLDDTAGIDANGLVQTAIASVLLDFKAASNQLMVKH